MFTYAHNIFYELQITNIDTQILIRKKKKIRKKKHIPDFKISTDSQPALGSILRLFHKFIKVLRESDLHFY